MAAGVLSKPGTDYGPCPEPCDHTDCRMTRETARSLCNLCGEPIGYERRFYADADRRYAHAVCVEDALSEEARARAVPDFHQAIGAIPLKPGMPTAAEAIHQAREEHS